MKFVDRVKILVRSGSGGSGCVAFRREKYVPRGGPAGGDGGDGGHVILRVDPGLSTLLDLRNQTHYLAKRGEHGQGHDRHGRSGEDLLIPVPCGTLVFDEDSGEQLADLTTPSQVFVAARGGRGGRGNIHFANSTNRAPRVAEDGQVSQERTLRLELKLIADVGLVGLPNAGKSTLISRISAARPKVADYPFTTLVPNLGVVAGPGDRSFVVADIPGLIEGAHRGAGLGHQFLRHVERTKILVFIVDDRHQVLGEDGDPWGDLVLLERELAAYDPTLLTRPRLVALNKVDAVSAERLAQLLQNVSAACEIFPISAVTGRGLPELVRAMSQRVSASAQAEAQVADVEISVRPG
jgi:GTP-binding protein